ncbi:MAG: response regulator [Lachnospiraceae bacterium]|nr:response regulator [Lachnospiraceae bacterium]
MDRNKVRNETYKQSHLIILIVYTVMSVVLIIESFIMDWEKWAIMLVVAVLITSWFMHIRSVLRDRDRLWLYSCLMMVTYFFYGVHLTSTFDMALVMCVVIAIYTMTGEKPLVRMCQVFYMVTLGFDLVTMISQGEEVTPLLVTRSLLHIGMIILAGWVACVIIDKWAKVIGSSSEEIETLKEQTDRLNNFLANVSHEIRTPVNAVMGLSSVLEKETLPENIEDNIRAISNAGHRVAEQIGDILDFTEIDMHRLSVSNEPYMIDSVVNDLLSQLSHMDQNDLDLVIDLDASVPAELRGDGEKIRKILLHLISNGFKYTREGGVYVRIYSVPREYGINLLLEVKDTGVGMTEFEIEHIYDKFYQSDSSKTRSVGGLGIGIPIVNGFVTAMNGFMDIQSRRGVGTTVKVSIPQAVEDNSKCMSVRNRESVAVGGFLGFMTTGNIGVREFYMDMISNIVAGLYVPFHRIQSKSELEKLLLASHISHLFIGTGEYLENREYIEELSKTIKIAIILDRNRVINSGNKITQIPKPFYGVQIANFLNQTLDDELVEGHEKMMCPGVKVLVVDDEPMNLLVARGIFESYGMIVDTVHSGEASIAKCAGEDYDVVFMDHMMPEMDGVEAMKRLRVQASHMRKDICVVALTANAISSAREMFMSEGFDGFVPKPIELPELERVLKHVLPKAAVKFVMDDGEARKIGGSKKSEAKTVKAEAKAEKVEAKADTDKQAEAKVKAESDRKEAAADKSASSAGGAFAPLDELGVDTAAGLAYCGGDEQFYKELLAEYAGDPNAKLEELTRYHDSKNWKDYSIKVHAIKSTSKMIGAMDLSSVALFLEEASKESDEEKVESKHKVLMESYEKLIRTIYNTYGAGSEASDADEGDVLEFGPKGGDL